MNTQIHTNTNTNTGEHAPAGALEQAVRRAYPVAVEYDRLSRVPGGGHTQAAMEALQAELEPVLGEFERLAQEYEGHVNAAAAGHHDPEAIREALIHFVAAPLADRLFQGSIRRVM